MKLKISQSLLTIIVLIESAPLSSADMMLNVITDFAELRSLSQAVTEIIRSLDGDKPSATNVIKVTSHEDEGAAGNVGSRIDLFTETILRDINGLFEIHIQKIASRTDHNALLIVSSEMAIHEIENFLRSFNFDSTRKLLIVLLERENFPPLESSIKLMLDIVWRKFILNVHVVSASRNGDVLLHTFFPFTKDFCGQVHPVLYNIYRNGAFVMQREHFPRKTDNFFGCPLTVAVFEAPPYIMLINENASDTVDVEGADGDSLKTLSSRLNFSINFSVVSDDLRWGEIYANESATGAQQLVR